jgi:hypothetical protein
MPDLVQSIVIIVFALFFRIENDENDEVLDHFAPKAQILLVCCWRAMKEVSLLLGEITKRAPVKEKDQSYGLLSFEQVYTVCDVTLMLS